MPSRRLQRLLPRRDGAARSAFRLAAVSLLSAALLTACSSAPPPPPREPVATPGPAPEPLALEQGDLAYLISPLEGFPQEVDPERRRRIETAYQDLLQAGAVEEAGRTAAELIEQDPGFYPAHVLAAQVEFAGGADADHRALVGRLLPVGDALPGYTASQLLLGRAAERLGDLPLAYAAYRAAAPRSQLAFQRTGEMHPRALEIVSNRLEEALRQERVDEAEQHLQLLRSWAPSELTTLEAARSVALARGDRAAELAAVKELSARRPDDRRLRERRAELELAVGDPSAGLQIIQELAKQNPNDPAMAEKLDAAKFRWRLSLLPKAVQEVAAKPELDKADLAVLLYWLVPDVRYGRTSVGRIATDVLDHPRQEEIVRVVNLGLMDVDPTLHRFSPSARVSRGGALRTLGRMLSRFASDASCVAGAGRDPSQAAACDLAARCGMIPAGEDCRTGSSLSGAEAVELIRRGLKVLGVS
jgi:tetratricopeptide (TPR) repeat protein